MNFAFGSSGRTRTFHFAEGKRIDRSELARGSETNDRLFTVALCLARRASFLRGPRLAFSSLWRIRLQFQAPLINRFTIEAPLRAEPECRYQPSVKKSVNSRVVTLQIFRQLLDGHDVVSVQDGFPSIMRCVQLSDPKM